MAKFSKIIDQLDNDIRKMSYNDVCSAVNSCETEDKLSFEVEAENIGMSFVENAGNKKLGCYYGPKLILKKDTGDPIYLPDITNITSDHIDYWTKRANITSNPLLKMRYTGLVWDLCKRITGKEPSFKDMKLQFIISSIETIEQDLADNPICGLNYIECAIKKAISINNLKLTDRAIKTMLAYEAKYSKDTYSGIWGRPFLMLLDHIAQFSSYENVIVKSMLDRFDRFEVVCKNGDMSAEYIHLLKDTAKLLADYYMIKQNIVKVKEFLDRYHVCLTLLYDTQGAMWAHGMIKNLQGLYRKYNLAKEANRLYLEIQLLASKIPNEMRPIKISVPIENDKIEEYFKPLLEGTIEEGMLISSYFIKMHIQKMKLKEMFTYDMVMNLFQNSPLILESQRSLLEKGMKAYFDQDYIVACHLLVPLFENAIRVVAASNGHEVLRSNANSQEGNEYVSLDRLLNDIEGDYANLKNLVAYFKNVFTDKNGWNTRNLLCHGALAASSFNDTLADRVVHAFLLLSQIKPMNKEYDSTNATEEAK
ncbi:hypothetical protein prwr041_24880 [Prevotella herbatica]|uniref:DUF4209 domain-containing protein n=1 Tax=Prevotella herbatica TaxID=2801997 RepID=A0ABN6EKU9_9BACT|nr:DUF4209 domain-containing protein [Prevotella herbatica]BCS86595.1 hypothetical protein prwr041_24880 [Prevotella herbatica]